MNIQAKNRGDRSAVRIIFLMFFLGILFAALLCTTAMATIAGKPKLDTIIKIRLASGDFDPLLESGSVEEKAIQTNPTYAREQDGYYIVQFDGPIELGQKGLLKQLGAHVFDYIPDFAFIVKMDETARKTE